MQINVTLENGRLPDLYGKFAPANAMYGGYPVVSFPIDITDAPAGTKAFALTLIDDDAVPMSGFSWIHWIAANIPATLTTIPADASRELADQMVQGANSTISKFVGETDPTITHRYTGPQPPDQAHVYTLTVMALDAELPLLDGQFYLNDLRHVAAGHVLAEASVGLPSRA